MPPRSSTRCDASRTAETVVIRTIVARLLGRRRRNDPLAALSRASGTSSRSSPRGSRIAPSRSALFVAERTVENHMSSIFGKLDLPESPDQHRRVLAVLTFLRA